MNKTENFANPLDKRTEDYITGGSLMRNRFDAQLEMLNNSLIAMGALCEMQVQVLLRL